MKLNRTLWTFQILLAGLFLFAGSMKLALPIAQMSAMSGLPGPFLRFIGIAEMTGAVGLVLPRLVKIQPALTPLAAAGLVLIMIGAVIVTMIAGSIAGALFPAVVGAALAAVAYGRVQSLAI